MSLAEKHRVLLLETLTLELEAVSSLSRSHLKCQAIGLKTTYSFEERESFDSLTSKFARTSGIFTQKLIKKLFIILGENPTTYLDRMNKAEQLGLN